MRTRIIKASWQRSARALLWQHHLCSLVYRHPSRFCYQPEAPADPGSPLTECCTHSIGGPNSSHEPTVKGADKNQEGKQKGDEGREIKQQCKPPTKKKKKNPTKKSKLTL